MLKLSLNPITSSALTLGVFALLGVILLSSVQWLTKDSIAENQRKRHLLSLHDIVAPEVYDNDLLASVIEMEIDNKQLAEKIKIYSAQLEGTEVAKVYAVTSPDGYSGAISLLVGVNADQRLRGVRVTSHKETPGLGDKVETNKSDWVLQFSGKSLNNPQIDQWKVQKDGGLFDEFTGATITPRAVVNAVRETLKFATKKQNAQKESLNE